MQLIKHTDNGQDTFLLWQTTQATESDATEWMGSFPQKLLLQHPR